MKSTKSIKINTVLNGIRMTLSVIVPLLIFPYTSRVFSTDGLGKINISSSIIEVFCIVSSLGIYSYAVREGVKIRNDKRRFSIFTKELLTINLIATILSYLLFFVCLFLIPQFFSYRKLLLIYCVQIGFSALGFDWMFGVFEDYLYLMVRQTCIYVVTLASLFIFIHEKSDVNRWAIISVIICVISNISNIFLAKKRFNLRLIRNEKVQISKHLTPIIILFSTVLASKAYSYIDTILLGVLSNDHHAGLYSAATKVNTVIITFLCAMLPVFVPRITEHIISDEKDNFSKMVSKVLCFIISLALPAFIGAEMLSEEIINIVAGNDFISATITLKIIAPVMMINPIVSTLYNEVFIPLNKEKYVLILTIVESVINIFFSVVLIPKYNENGAAIGSLISEIIILLLVILIMKKKKYVTVKTHLINYLIGSVIIILWCIVAKFMVDGVFCKTVISITGSVLLYFGYLIIRKDIVAVEAMQLYHSLINRIRRKCV